MITSAILHLLYYFVYVLLSPLLLFSDVSLTGNIAAAVASAGQYMSILNITLPVDTLISVVGLFVLIEGFIFLFKLFKWIYKKIPGIN